MTVSCLWLAAAAVSPAMASAALLIAALVFQAIGIAVGSARLFVVGTLFWLPVIFIHCW